jgi:type IV pilus assembly protein PilM
MHGSDSLFWRDITFGGNQYTDAIQRELSLSFAQAEALKKGEPVGDRTIQQVIPILNSVSEDFAGELRKTLDFFTATSGAERVDEIILSGGGSSALNLDAILGTSSPFRSDHESLPQRPDQRERLQPRVDR